MKKSNPISETLSRLLKAHGFRKKSNTWYSEHDESRLVVNLQKSQYGDQFYVNFGIALRALDPPEFPKEYQCHVRFRLEAALPESERDQCRAALDLEELSMMADDRKATVGRLMETHGVPLLKDCSSVEGIAEACRNGRLDGAMVHKNVKALLAETDDLRTQRS